MTAASENADATDRFMVILGTDVSAPVIEPMPAEQNLLQSLCDRIERRTVDVVSLRINGTDLTAWVDDEGAIASQRRMNVQIMRLAATTGRPGLVLFGTAVITGGADHDGDTLGLSTQIAEQVAAHAADARRSVDRLIVRAMLANETPIPIVEHVAANLYRSRVHAATHWNPELSASQTRQSERVAGDGHIPTTDRRPRNARVEFPPPRQDPTRRHGNGPSASPGNS